MATIRQGREVRGRERLDCDVVVVGSGAGGAAAAHTLASAGLDVIVLEAGPHIPPHEFTQRELDTLTRVYVDRGGQGTKDGSLSVLQGECVGGSTVINGEVCFRTPEGVLESWSRRFDVRGLEPDVLAPIFEQVERMIHATPNEARYMTHTTHQAEGMRALGIEPRPVVRNVKGCRGCAYCFFGCAYGCKQSMDQSYLPAALAQGARVICEARVEQIDFEGTTACGVTARTPEGTLEVRAQTVILACGAIATPLMLLDHKLGGPQVGRHLAVHPVVFVTGFYDDPVPEPQTMLGVYTDAFLEAGFLAEFGLGSLPFSAMGLPGFGAEHVALRRDIGHLSAGGAIIRDVGELGRVRRDWRGRKVIDYALDARTQHTLRTALKKVAEITFAGGAHTVYLPTVAPCILESPDEIHRIDSLPLGPADITLISYHPQCTAALGRVTHNDGLVRGTRNVYVMDASLFPTPVGVNPQVSVLGVVTALAQTLAARMGA